MRVARALGLKRSAPRSQIDPMTGEYIEAQRGASSSRKSKLPLPKPALHRPHLPKPHLPKPHLPKPHLPKLRRNKGRERSGFDGDISLER